MTTNRSQATAVVARAAMPAAETLPPRQLTDSPEVPVSSSPSFLSPFAALVGVDLRDRPITGAQCRFDPNLHTGPDAAETPEERAAREDVAREVCASCPLLGSCREYALSTGPESGIWAGLSVLEIRTMREAAREFGEVA